MQVWQIPAFGVENLQQAERQVAGLESPLAADEVLVRIRAVSLNYRDLMMVQGSYNPKLRLPRTPCSDGAGEVISVGKGVSEFVPGDRVASCFFQNWQEGAWAAQKGKGALGGDVDGMLAEYAVLKADGLVRLPEHLSFAEGATLPCAAVTAWSAVVNAGNIKAGQVILVQGTGGVSMFALQIAKLLGARVLGTSGSDEKLERAKALGLDAGINYRSTPDWEKWVLDETGGEGADLVVEVGGAGTLQRSLKAVKAGGTVAQIGVLTGVVEPMDIRDLLFKQVRLQGIYVGSRADFHSLNKAVAQSRLKPVIGRSFTWNETHEAFLFMEQARHFGKIVIEGKE